MFLKRASSSCVTMLMHVPSRPARAVRPLRWTYLPTVLHICNEGVQWRVRHGVQGRVVVDHRLHFGKVHAACERVAAHEHRHSALPHAVDDASALLLGQRAAVFGDRERAVPAQRVTLFARGVAGGTYSCRKRATLWAPSTVEEKTTVTRPCILSSAWTRTTSLSSVEHMAMYLPKVLQYFYTGAYSLHVLAQLFGHLQSLASARSQKQRISQLHVAQVPRIALQSC
jgi:hypothetical protein